MGQSESNSTIKCSYIYWCLTKIEIYSACVSSEASILCVCVDGSSRCHVHTHVTPSLTCALMLCVVLPVETVCGKLCVHPEQPDVPAGGRGYGSVQQDHSSGQACRQGGQPGRRRPHRLLQSTEQIAGTRGETRTVHNLRPAHLYLGDTFNYDTTSDLSRRCLFRVCLSISPFPQCDLFGN